MLHSRPIRALLGRAGADRRRRDTAQADAGVGHDAVADAEGERDRDARDVVEPALGDLVERGDPRQRQRDPHRADQLVGAADAPAVAGEVLLERDDPLAARRDQHDAGAERQQRGTRVADRRAGAEVAADRGAVADERRGELRGQLGQQRHPAREPALDLGDRQRGADLDLVVADGELAQFGQPLDRDDERRARRRAGSRRRPSPSRRPRAARPARRAGGPASRRAPRAARIARRRGCTSVGTGSGAGCRRLSASGSAGSGIPSPYAASRIGR